jgi:CubicO group peptidase (beta-lactamase class C family)
MKYAIWFAACAGLLAGQDLATRMDDAVKAVAGTDHRYMGSVLVARGDDVILSRAYGYANLEWDIPNTPDTKFRLGSISKQFTAACILKLEEQGKLRVNDPVKKYLDDAPAAWDKITLHQVLSHTAGIPNFTGFPEYRTIEKQPATLERTYRVFRDKPLDFEPGTQWKYSNSGYLLLSYLIEKISGQRYEDFLRNNALQPAGMRDSGYDLNARILHHRASGYTPFGATMQNAGYIDMTVPGGAGALYSTTQDLLRWEQALFGGKVISAASLARMTTPVQRNYGYGLRIAAFQGHKSIGHGGGIEGFNTQLTYFPDDRLTVVVLANVNGPLASQIANRLAALALDVEPPR